MYMYVVLCEGFPFRRLAPYEEFYQDYTKRYPEIPINGCTGPHLCRHIEEYKI